jgi:type I restriction enzyme S subunit
VNWPVVALAEAAKIARVGVAPEDIIAGTTYVGLENMDGLGDFVGVSGVNAGELGSTKFRFSKDQVLFGKLRPYLKKTARPSFDGVCSTDILPLSPAKHVDRDYLFHVLRRQSFVDEVTSLCVGANLPRISPAVLGAMLIPLPPLPEQRRIAAILDKADALRAKRREAIAKLDQLLQSVFLDMFGDASDTNATVEELSAADGAIRTGPFGSQLLHSEFVDSGVAVLGIDNVVSNKFVWAKPRFITEQKYAALARYTVSPGDVLITIMGTCGRCAVVPEDVPTAINTKHLCCISLDKKRCEPEFLHSYFLMHPQAQSYLEGRAKGAIMSGLNMGIIKEMPVALPPIERQWEFVSIKAALRLEQAKMGDYLSHSNQLFEAIQQQAFAGTL